MANNHNGNDIGRTGDALHQTSGTDRISGAVGDARDKLAEIGADARDKVAELGTEARDKVAELGTEARDKVADLSTKASGKIADFSGEARTRVADFSEEARTRVADFSEEARNKVSDARDRFANLGETTNDQIDHRPLIALGAGIALGAVLAAVLPASKREKDLLSPLGSKITEAGSGAVDRARDMGKQKFDEIAGDQVRDFFGSGSKNSA